jgi:hypothetical protein
MLVIVVQGFKTSGREKGLRKELISPKYYKISSRDFLRQRVVAEFAPCIGREEGCCRLASFMDSQLHLRAAPAVILVMR